MGDFTKEELEMIECSLDQQVLSISGDIEIAEECNGDPDALRSIQIGYGRLIEKVRKM